MLRRTHLGVVLAALAVWLAAPGAAHGAGNLVGQWHMDERESQPNEGPDFTPDSSGNGAHLQTCNGCMSIEPGGRFANQLGPGNNGTVRTADSEPQLRPQRVTLLAWVRFSSTVGDSRIAGHGVDETNCGDATGYALRTVFQSEDEGDLTEFSIGVAGGGSISSPGIPDERIWDGQWHLLVGTYDRERLRVYLDGDEIGDGTAASAPIAYGADTARFAVDGQGGCGGITFPGGIDEVRVYDNALSATEIERLASATGSEPPALEPDEEPPPPAFTPAPQPTPIPPVQPPPPPPPPPVAAFTGPTQVERHKPAIFDARPTTGASALLWDIGGDGRPDIRTTQPVLSVRLPFGRPVRVTLTAISPTGQSSSTSSRLLVTGPRPAAGARPGIAPPAVAATADAPSFFTALVAACRQSTVVFQLVEAAGCFQRLDDLAKVPAGERAVVQQHYTSAGLPAVVNILCRDTSTAELRARCERARETFGPGQLDVYVSRQAVKVNGITIRPTGGASVVVYPKTERIVSSRAVVEWAGKPLGLPDKVDLNLKRSGLRTGRAPGATAPPFPTGSAQLLHFDAKKVLPSIGGFRPDLTAALGIEARDGQRLSTADVWLRLPSGFKLFGGTSPTTQVRFTATNGGGPAFDFIDAQVPQAELGPVKLTELRFRYARGGGLDRHLQGSGELDCPRDEWKAQANIYIAGKKDAGAGFLLSPPPRQNGIGFCAGRFKHAGGRLLFGGPIPRPKLGPGVFLDEVNFAVQLDPALVRGGGQISVADVSVVRGALLLALATPARPYVLTPGDAGAEFRQLAGRRFDSTTVAIGGNVSVKVPKYGQLGFGNGALMYSFPEYVFFGGGVRVVVPGLSVEGGVSGEIDFAQRLFQTGGSVTACLAGVDIGINCAGADANLGSRGVSACLRIAGRRPGAGYRWGELLPEVWLFDGCKPSRFWVVIRRRARAAQAGGTTVTLEEGEDVKHVRLTGDGGAPSVTVRGPSGASLEVSGTQVRFGDGIAGLRVEDRGNGATFLSLRGRPGTYAVELLPGSVPIRAVAASRKGYDTNFTARVTGRGSARVLTYDARRPGGQSVTFAERGHGVFRVLGTSRGGRGRIRFTPAVGPARRRTIVAIATLDGTPIPEQTLTSYRAGDVRTGRPSRVRIRRRGERLVVRWAPASGAAGYGIVVQRDDGVQRTFEVGARRRELVLRSPVDHSVVVSISARGARGEWTPARSARLRRLRPPATAVQTDASNERRDARATP